MTNQWDGLIAAAASKHRVPFALIKATMEVESGGNPLAMNYNDPGYAWGLMQMIPSTARGLKPPYTGPMSALVSNPELAIDLGTNLLAENLRRARGVIPDTVSAYNGGFQPQYGLGSVRPNGTYQNQAYVDRVMAAYRRYAGDDFSDVESGGSSTGLAPYTPPVGNAPLAGMLLAIALGLGLLWLLRAGKGFRL